MSAIGAALAKGIAALGGPAPATAILVGGLAVGAIGGGIAASGGPQSASANGALAVYACPGTGAPLLTIPGGQRLLATGRTEDSAWLRIHYPDPGRSEAWVESGPLETSGSIADLPVAACAPEIAALVPSFVPPPGLTAVQNNPPTPPPSGEPTPTPTATPAIAGNERPALARLTATPSRISFDTGDFCPNAESTATFRVRAEDDEGVQSVALFWREPGSGSFVRAPMTRVSGSLTNGTWQAALDTVRNGITQNGNLAYYAVATDTDGATRRLPGNGSSTIRVERCVNEGPDITSVRSSGGSPLYEDPFGVSRCQTATNITAVVRDPQGVASVRLFYRRPADGSFRSKPMTLQDGGRWFANLDTLGDRITIVNPPSGTLRWYIQATDDEGATSRIDTRLVPIRRCDTEAIFGGSSTYPETMCAGQATNFYGSAEDPDGINGRSAFLVYTYRRADGTQRTARVRMHGNRGGAPWYYQVAITPGANWAYNQAVLSYHLETTDRFGGKSSGGQSRVIVSGC